MCPKLQLCLTLFIIFCYATTIEAANTTTTSAPKASRPCECKGLTCKYCQSTAAGPIHLGKIICIQFQLIIKPLKLNVQILLDNTTLADFNVDPKQPPTACILIVLPMNVAMCVRLQDMKLVGLTAVQVCASLHLNFIKKQVLSYKLTCVKMGATGVSFVI